MKRWTVLGAVGCVALLAALVVAAVGRMAPSVADATVITYSIDGVVWDDTPHINGVKDGDEVAPTADVDLHLCAGDNTFGCREDVNAESTSIDGSGGYHFTQLPAGWYTVCLDVTPPTEWTLTMVLHNGSQADPNDVDLRCYAVELGTGSPSLDWGIAHIASELSVTKVCAPMSLSQGDIECTITAKNEGETILPEVGVQDYYLCNDFDLYGSPDPDNQGEHDGDCWVGWDIEKSLGPGDEETVNVRLTPKHTTGTAQNCADAAAWNVIIPGVDQDATVAALFIAEGYDAYWEDVVAQESCVSFGEPERHRRSTSTPVPTATPTEVPPPPPTATIAPPLPTATPYGGPAGVGISPPATGTGLASQGVPNVAWWLASFGTLTLGLGASVALAFRKTR
jgi:hypothetical protein